MLRDVSEWDLRGVGTAIHFHDVDPQAHASQAAALLRRSWAPPCPRYSDSYVRWQLAFPGAVRPRAVLATDGARTVGFVALIPRQLSTADGVAVIYVLSFFAVDPHYRDAHIGTRLASRIVEISDRPIVTYTAPGSRSERALAQSATARGWTFRHMATLQTYVGGADRHPQTPVVARQATVEEFRAAMQASGSTAIAWSQPTLEQARHYMADPRGACFAVAHGMNGVALGAALIVRSEIITASGTENVPSLDAVQLHDRHAAALRALRAFALKHAGGASIVTAPNLEAVPPEAIRLAGFRATQSALNVAVMGNAADAITRQAISTNLEVL
jgi:hypothetical protein